MNVSIIFFMLIIVFQKGSAESSELITDEGPIPHPKCPLNEDPFNPTHLPYPNDCTKFYKCSGGLAYPMKCPAGLHWAIDLDRCDWPFIAKCNETKELTFHRREYNEILRLDKEVPIKHPNCPVNENPEKPTHLAYPGNCSKFYKCQYSYAYPMSCPSGLHWSVDLDRCDYPSVANCKPYEVTTSAPEETTANTEPEGPIPHPKCPVDENPQNPTHLAYPGNCSKFYKCQYGYAYPMSCPSGLHWAVHLNRCDYPSVANCELHEVATFAREIATENTEPEGPIPHPKCPVDENPQNPTHLAYPGNCSKFYKCQYGYAYPMSCPSGLHWSVDLDRCDYPSVANCEPYEGTTSAPEKTTANTEPEGPIPHPKCPVDENPQNPTHLAYPGNCSKFYKCQYGYAYPMSCPSGLHWAVHLDRCDYPSLANCTKDKNDNDSEDPITEDASNNNTTTSEGTTIIHNTTIDVTTEAPWTSTPNTTSDVTNTTTEKSVNAVCKNTDYTTLQPHPTDCTKFIQCDYGVAHIRQCPANLHFSVHYNQCQWPAIADCQIK